MSLRTALFTSTVVAAFLGLAVAGCDPAGERAGEGAGLETPGGAGGVGVAPPEEGVAEGDSADELNARRQRLYLEFKALVDEGSHDPDTCERLCSLATSICGVQEKLCNIADDHVGDDHYQSLCREAKRQCRDAQDRCIECVERHANGSCGGATAAE